MRVSAEEERAWNMTAFLDGQPVKHAVMADEELGIVEVYATNDDGASIINAPTVFLRGKVEIKPGSLADHGVTDPWHMVEVG